VSDPLRVLQVNKFFHPRAGAETSFLQTRELLHERGHEVIDFAMRHPDNLDSDFASYFAPERTYGEGSPGSRVRDAAASVYSPSARRAIARLLDDHMPDVAHLHNVYHQLSLSVVDELAKRGVPVVLTLHDWKVACPSYTLFTEGAPCRRCPTGSVANAVVHRCVKGSRAASGLAAAEAALARRRGTYAKIDRFIAPSRFAIGVAELAGIDREKVDLLPNFLTDADLAAGGSARVDEGPRILYAGRLDATKGLRQLLAAFALVQSPATLRVAGDGDLADEVRAAATHDGRITYLGRLPRARLREELGSARAVVLPSIWEDNGPFVLLEAQAEATAAIVTDRGGPKEFVRDGETGLVVDPEDVAALARAIERFATDAPFARECGRRARADVVAEQNAARHYEGLVGVYERAIAAGA
jgi:glycosyltransferase involved in cell wall biosynthesis